MYRYADNVVEESTTTTTGAYQLGGVPSGAEPGARTFVAGIGDSNSCDYYAKEVGGTAWERGIGTVTDATPDTLTRTAVHTSSNANAAVDWTGKTVEIMAVLPARRLATDHAGMVENLTLAASRSGNAETIAVKTLAGTDPSPTDPVRVAFAKTDGTFEVLELTAALSLTISSGSTLGATSGEAFRVWVTLFNDAGTLRLGAVKCALADGVRSLIDNAPESSTTEGGAGGADSAGVIYTGTAVTSKAMRVLGYLEYMLATAGTWDAAPSVIRLAGDLAHLPGDVVQVRRNQTGAFATASLIIPFDDTIPQNNEGTEFMTQAITPRSALNLLAIEHFGLYSYSVNYHIVAALFQDSGADALAANASSNDGTQMVQIGVSHRMRAGTTSQTTFKVRAGGNTAGNIRFNGYGVNRLFGGVAASYLAVTEIMT